MAPLKSRVFYSKIPSLATRASSNFYEKENCNVPLEKLLYFLHSWASASRPRPPASAFRHPVSQFGNELGPLIPVQLSCLSKNKCVKIICLKYLNILQKIFSSLRVYFTTFVHSSPHLPLYKYQGEVSLIRCLLYYLISKYITKNLYLFNMKHANFNIKFILLPYLYVQICLNTAEAKGRE